MCFLDWLLEGSLHVGKAKSLEKGSLKGVYKALLEGAQKARAHPFVENSSLRMYKKSARRGSFGPDIPADIRPRTSVRPSKP